MKIIIPMAGAGSRFKQISDQNPEYAVKKPLIKVKGVPMIKWATSSYRFLQQDSQENKPVKLSDLVFICLKEHDKEYGIGRELIRIYSSKIRIIWLESPTRGAAETALKASDFIEDNEDIIISDSDHYFDATPLWNSIQNKDENVVGILPVIKPPDTKPTWSYVRSPDGIHVTDVKEKDPKLALTGYGILGGYYFSKSRIFKLETENMIKENDVSGQSDKKEFYVSQIYRRLLLKGNKIEMALIKAGWVIGTPEHLDYFLKTYKGNIPSMNL